MATMRILGRCSCILLFKGPFLPRQLSCANMCTTSNVVTEEHEERFPEMLRRSQFAKLFRPVDRTVLGNISHIVNNELYIDIGWKFHAVVKVDAGKVNSQVYSVGDVVEVKINELEMTGHFLGQHKRITLCEANVSLVEDEE